MNQKNKFKIIFLLFVISAITGLSHLVGFYFLKNNYSIFPIKTSLYTREKSYGYVVRTKQILRGDLIPGDSQLFEYQHHVAPYVGETIPSYVAVFLSSFFGSPEKGFIAADFILPPLVFLLIFSFVYSVTRKTNLSIVSGLISVFARDFFLYMPYPAAIIKYLYLQESYINDLVITRSYHPQISIFFFLTFVFCFYKCVLRPTKIKIIITGFLFGMLFYTYVFYASAVMIGLGIYFLINIKDKEKRKLLIIILAIGGLITLPYIINMSNFNNYLYSKDFIFRSTGDRFEFPLPEARRFIILSLFFLFVLRKDFKSKIFNSFILAGAILPDLSYLFLRRDLESIHWIWVVVFPLTAIYYPILIDKYILSKLKPNSVKLIYIIVIISFFYYGYKIQIHSGFKFNRYQQFTTSEIQLFGFLNKQPKKSVVQSLYKGAIFREANSLVLLLTDNYIYVPFSTLTVAPSEEILERQLIALSLIKNKKQILNEDFGQILSNVYTFLNVGYMKKNDSILQRKINNKLNSLEKYCHMYRLDYVVISNSQKIRENCFKTKKIYSNIDYKVYKILK